MPGDVGFSFNNEAFPGSAQAGSQFAIPGYAGCAVGSKAGGAASAQAGVPVLLCAWLSLGAMNLWR